MRFTAPRLQPWQAAMPRITRARADARRRQIIEAALTCFARKGFHKTTMQDVVEQSGLSPGSIYCHFAGKQDIIVAVVEERHRRERASLQRAFEKQSFAETVDQLAIDFVATLHTPEERAWRRLTVQLWAESLHDRRLAIAVRDGVERPRAMLARMVQRAKARGELPSPLDAHATARLLIAFFQGLVLQLAWDGNVDTQACVIALKGLIAPEKS
jgi:TetR/AcrR family transcriptional regulator, transcriptional repressor of aconitase